MQTQAASTVAWRNDQMVSDKKEPCFKSHLLNITLWQGKF